jgi:predicted  nucleic acid-binding Zn-ribbon protein
MTTSDDAGQEPATEELTRLDDERSQLREEIQGLHEQLHDAGPMDAADRSSILTQVEELEGVLSGLDARREKLQPGHGGTT